MGELVIPEDYVKDTCRFGQGTACCSFLMMGADWHCAKGTDIEAHIRTQRATGKMNAMGNNCPGFATIKALEAQVVRDIVEYQEEQDHDDSG